MKSKPIYAELELDTSAKRHSFVVQGAGIAAARRALMGKRKGDAQVVCVAEGASAASALKKALAEMGMDTAFYVAGPEQFLWEATRLLREAGVEKRRIQQELAGSAARKVYCVHCHTVHSGVITSIYPCTQCGTTLTVRDHFSRPLGAYMGVCAAAETPGLAPEPEALYA